MLQGGLLGLKIVLDSVLHGPYLTQSVFEVVLQKATPPQIRQLILYYY